MLLLLFRIPDTTSAHKTSDVVAKIRESTQRRICKRLMPRRKQFTQYGATDRSFKHVLRFLKLQRATQPQTQQSLAIHRNVLKEKSSRIEHSMIPQPVYEA